jgi:hypothetical protein
LYSSPSIIEEDDMGRAYSTNVEKRNACRILVGKPEGKRPLGRPKHRRVDNIKMGHREREREMMGWVWTNLSQDRNKRRALVNGIMSLRVP